MRKDKNGEGEDTDKENREHDQQAGNILQEEEGDHKEGTGD